LSAGGGSGGRALRALERPGAWLWLALLLGAALRLWLVTETEGSFDVAIKRVHAHAVATHGVLGAYARSEILNHPPLMARFFAAAAALAEWSGVPFRTCLRAPFALLDLGTALLLLHLLRGSRWRFAALAAYWLHPLALVFSAYHGNTDSAVAFFALLAMAGAVAGRPALAGAAVGVGLWVKLPVLLAAPALCLAFAGWRERALFAASALAVGAAGALPELAQDPALLYRRIVAYPGTGVVTPRGVAVWGIWWTLRLAGTPLADAAAAHNTVLVLAPIAALAWLRRGRRSAFALGATLCASFALLYGTTSFWAFQYLAWSLPFWFFLDARIAAPVTGLLAAYVYGVYALYTGSPWLLGRWDFVRHAPWPALLTGLRDASVAACFLVGWGFLARAALRRPARGEAAG
jgi:hypothetical protein